MRPTFEEAKREYPHRFTMEHAPDWAKEEQRPDGKYYAPHYKTDCEWYSNSHFYHDGCSCTNLSWPIGKELDKPFSKGDY